MTNQLSITFFQQLCDQENEPRAIVKAQSPCFELVAYNNLFVQMSHTEGKELIGKCIAEIQSWNIENEEGAIEIYDALTSTIQTKATVRLPVVRYDLTGHDGTITPSWWQAIYEPLLNAESNVEYVLCIVHNITAEVGYEPTKLPDLNQTLS